MKTWREKNVLWDVPLLGKLPRMNEFAKALKMQCLCEGPCQRVTGILVPGNSRENQLHLFPLDLEKLNSISRLLLETRDKNKKNPVLVSRHEMSKKNSRSRLEK